MKECCLLLVLLFATFVLDAQEYTIGFVASGASSKVDSVFIQNPATGTSIAIGGQETLHITATNTEITPDVSWQQNNIHVFPNPFEGQTIVEFSVNTTGAAIIELSDLSGKTLFSKELKTTPGNEQFALKGIGRGVYILRVKTKNNNYIAKLISTASPGSDIMMHHLGNVARAGLQPFTKNATTENAVQYKTGDLLILTGVSGNYSTVVPLTPTKDTIVTFDFVTCTDADGNNYPVVKIGTQLWMAENLKTTKYRNGVALPHVPDNSDWSDLTTGAYCAYDNSSANSDIYGYLYNWYAASDSSNIAPLGWHVPSETEWNELADYLGESSVIGGKLKSPGTDYWNFPNEGATNETGFSGLPGGARAYSGTYSYVGKVGYFWSSTSADSFGAWLYPLFYDEAGAFIGYNGKKFGYSVRCLKDKGLLSYLEINGERYELTQGAILNYGNFEGHGVYNHQVLLYNSEIDINWNEGTLKGTGPVIDFEIFNTKNIVDNGYYSFSIPEIAETVIVYDSIDINGDGIINILDYHTTLPEGKYYISSRLSFYGEEIDLNSNTAELPLIKSGNVVFSLSEGIYSIFFDCIGENGDTIKGHFEGPLKYLDFSEE